MTNPATRRMYHTPYAAGDLFGSSVFWWWETERQYEVVDNQCSDHVLGRAEVTMLNASGQAAIERNIVLPLFRHLVRKSS